MHRFFFIFCKGQGIYGSIEVIVDEALGYNALTLFGQKNGPFPHNGMDHEIS